MERRKLPVLAPSRGRNMAQGLNKSFGECPTVVKESNSNYMYKGFHWYCRENEVE